MKLKKVMLLILIIWLVIPAITYGLNDGAPLRKGENRPTIDPSLFKDPFVRAAYRIAKEIPLVLDSIYCYCHCEEPPFNHKSLLSCYVDNHASV